MRARVLAPLTAALVGIVAGTVTALVTVSPANDDQETPETIVDPLGLRIPMVRLDCTDQGVLVLGYGDTAPPLGAAVASNQGEDLSYVDTADSCDTVFGPERLTKPAYAVVLGPFDGLVEPCQIRMEPEHRGDFVTRLREGNEDSVKCVCALPDSAGPVLRPGMTADAADEVWIRSLQGTLVDLDDELFSRAQITGQYDEATELRIRQLQESSSGVADGVVDRDVWRLLQRRACDLYDF